MSALPEAAKYNNRILKVLRCSSITNDELMAVTRQIDKLTSLALSAADTQADIRLPKRRYRYD